VHIPVYTGRIEAAKLQLCSVVVAHMRKVSLCRQKRQKASYKAEGPPRYQPCSPGD
jgi:hypothetical protein